MREIPKKNYIIMFFIILLVVIITIFLSSTYKNRVRKVSTMYNFLSEIKFKDLDIYLLENPNTIIYISNKYDLKNKELENELKEQIVEFNLQDNFVYLNIDEDNFDYLETFNSKYDGNLSTKKIPVVVVMESGKVLNYYYEIDNVNFKEMLGEIK